MRLGGCRQGEEEKGVEEVEMGEVVRRTTEGLGQEQKLLDFCRKSPFHFIMFLTSEYQGSYLKPSSGKKEEELRPVEEGRLRLEGGHITNNHAGMNKINNHYNNKTGKTGIRQKGVANS